jgi:hypothetical protein
MSRRTKYPYEEWADGQEHVAVWGVDYFVRTRHFIGAVQNYSDKHFLLFTVINVDYNGKATKVTFRLERQFQDA